MKTELVKIQLITIAQVRRTNPPPRKCNIHKFHVWRWEGEPGDDLKYPPVGLKCQCGALTADQKRPPVAP